MPLFKWQDGKLLKYKEKRKQFLNFHGYTLSLRGAGAPGRKPRFFLPHPLIPSP